jgi:diphosphomevalonate decarboxylase
VDSRLSATARAHPNLALIKYWGNRDEALRLPANASISFNLSGLETITSVAFEPRLTADSIEIDGLPAQGAAGERVVRHLDHIRALSGQRARARVDSRSNFPAGTGIASSASAFAALTVAACAACGLSLPEDHLSRIARLGSGSAARSIPDGFVALETGARDEQAFAHSLAAHTHWDLVDCIALVSRAPKSVGSSEGHRRAATSPLQPARVEDAPRRLEACRRAIQEKDLLQLGDVVEQDCLLMHSVMMTSRPSLLYWLPVTVHILHQVREWRSHGLAAAFTIDAGPNVHCLCEAASLEQVVSGLSHIPGVGEVIVCHPAPGATRIS